MFVFSSKRGALNINGVNSTDVADEVCKCKSKRVSAPT